MPKAPIDTDFIETLAKLLQSTDLTEIEIEKDDLKVRVAREITREIVHTAAPQAIAAPIAAPAAAPQGGSAPAQNESAQLLSPAGTAVTSPMVGTAYLASSPDKPPFVNIGDTVKEGQTVLIVEAMKTFNEIPAPKSGKVSSLLVQDGQPVEFGETLMMIE